MLKCATLMIAAILLFQLGCTSQRQISDEVGENLSNEKIVADAYLFDARLFQDGKPTSVRLEFYLTDSVVGISGRGYLGKGALKGWATADSLVVYFPSTNEYVRSSLSELLNSSEDCVPAEGEFDVTRLFNIFPDVLLSQSDYIVESDTASDRPEFRVFTPGCSWQLRLEYSEEAEKMFLYDIEFDNGKETELKARRRTLKEKAEVPLSRFDLTIPPGALEIIP